MDGFDTSNLSKEGLESLNVMQQVVPNAEAVFAAAEAKLSNISFAGVENADNVSLKVNIDASSGRAAFNYTVDDQTISLRTDDGLFTQEFYDDERITGDCKILAVKELQNIRFSTAEQNAPTAITQSMDFMLKGVSSLATDSTEQSAEAKLESANAMNLATSLMAFSNAIPAEFGSALVLTIIVALLFNFKTKDLTWELAIPYPLFQPA